MYFNAKLGRLSKLGYIDNTKLIIKNIEDIDNGIIS